MYSNWAVKRYHVPEDRQAIKNSDMCRQLLLVKVVFLRKLCMNQTLQMHLQNAYLYAYKCISITLQHCYVCSFTIQKIQLCDTWETRCRMFLIFFFQEALTPISSKAKRLSIRRDKLTSQFAQKGVSLIHIIEHKEGIKDQFPCWLYQMEDTIFHFQQEQDIENVKIKCYYKNEAAIRFQLKGH